MAKLDFNTFIDLDRCFCDVTKLDPTEDSYLRSYTAGFLGVDALLDWEDLYKIRVVVILGEPGSGKTREMQNQAEILKEKMGSGLLLTHVQSGFNMRTPFLQLSASRELLAHSCKDTAGCISRLCDASTKLKEPREKLLPLLSAALVRRKPFPHNGHYARRRLSVAAGLHIPQP